MTSLTWMMLNTSVEASGTLSVDGRLIYKVTGFKLTCGG